MPTAFLRWPVGVEQPVAWATELLCTPLGVSELPLGSGVDVDEGGSINLNVVEVKDEMGVEIRPRGRASSSGGAGARAASIDDVDTKKNFNGRFINSTASPFFTNGR